MLTVALSAFAFEFAFALALALYNNNNYNICCCASLYSTFHFFSSNLLLLLPASSVYGIWWGSVLWDMNDAPDTHTHTPPHTRTHSLFFLSLFLCLVLFNFLSEAAAILLTEKVQEMGLCFGGPKLSGTTF